MRQYDLSIYDWKWRRPTYTGPTKRPDQFTAPEIAARRERMRQQMLRDVADADDVIADLIVQKQGGRIR